MFTAREILALRCFGNHTQIGKHGEEWSSVGNRDSLSIPLALRRRCAGVLTRKEKKEKKERSEVSR